MRRARLPQLPASWLCVGDNACALPDDPNRPWVGGTRAPTAATGAIGSMAPNPVGHLATRRPPARRGPVIVFGSWLEPWAGPATVHAEPTRRSPPPLP